MRRVIPMLLCVVLVAGCSVSGGGNTTKDTSESLITVTKITASDKSFVESDVSNGQSDSALVEFQNTTKSGSITSPSPFFGVTLTHYRVVFSRGDGGPAPAPFDGAMSVFVPPPTISDKGVVTAGTASATIVIVSASAKTVSPLVNLESGQSFSANATITFDGQDGLGRAVSVPPGGIAVIFRRP